MGVDMSLEQRHRFIECMLICYGAVGKRELMEWFSVGETTAVRTLNAYAEENPHNVEYNDSTKRYNKITSFRRKYF